MTPAGERAYLTHAMTLFTRTGLVLAGVLACSAATSSRAVKAAQAAAPPAAAARPVDYNWDV